MRLCWACLLTSRGSRRSPLLHDDDGFLGYHKSGLSKHGLEPTPRHILSLILGGVSSMLFFRQDGIRCGLGFGRLYDRSRGTCVKSWTAISVWEAMASACRNLGLRSGLSVRHVWMLVASMMVRMLWLTLSEFVSSVFPSECSA